MSFMEEELFPGSKNKIITARNTLQRSILKIHFRLSDISNRRLKTLWKRSRADRRLSHS